MVIHILPHLTQIIPTKFFTLWTDQIHQVGLIRINTTHIPNLMTIISKIIFTLHRVNRDSTPPSQIFNHLVHNFHNSYNIHFPLHFLYSFSRTTNWRKIRVRKEYRSQPIRGRATSENVGLSNFTIFLRVLLSSTSSYWTTICPENEWRTLVWV